MSKQRRPATSALMCGNCRNKRKCGKTCLGYVPKGEFDYEGPPGERVFCDACDEREACKVPCRALAVFLNRNFRVKSSPKDKPWTTKNIESAAAPREGRTRRVRGLF